MVVVVVVGGGGGSLTVPDRNAGAPQFRPPPRPPVLETVIPRAQSWSARACVRAGLGVASPLEPGSAELSARVI